VFEETKRLI
jgi:hypothetical protein